MEHDSKPDAENTVEHGSGAGDGRARDGRFGPDNTFAVAQRGRPKDARRLLRETMREASNRVGGQSLIDRLLKEKPVDMVRILARLEPKHVAFEDSRQQVVMVMLRVPPPPGWPPRIAAD